MNKNVLRLICLLPMMTLLLVGVVSAVICQSYTYATSSGSTDYLGVLTNAYNSTVVGADEKLTAYTFFTPRLNFTASVGESIPSGNVNTTVSTHWKMNGTSFTEVNNSFVLKNYSTTIPRTNYTLSTSDNITYTVQWKDARYNTSTNVSATWNRTFVKNVDDLILHPELINSDTPYTSSWLDQNVSSAYGGTSYFKLDDYLPYGLMVNNTNWAVGWSLTVRTCLSATLSNEAVDGINNTRNLAFAGFALLAVLILAAIAFGIVQIFNGGSGDLMTLAILAIGGAVILVVAYVIIYFVAAGLGA